FQGVRERLLGERGAGRAGVEKELLLVMARHTESHPQKPQVVPGEREQLAAVTAGLLQDEQLPRIEVDLDDVAPQEGHAEQPVELVADRLAASGEVVGDARGGRLQAQLSEAGPGGGVHLEASDVIRRREGPLLKIFADRQRGIEGVERRAAIEDELVAL